MEKHSCGMVSEGPDYKIIVKRGKISAEYKSHHESDARLALIDFAKQVLDCAIGFVQSVDFEENEGGVDEDIPGE